MAKTGIGHDAGGHQCHAFHEYSQRGGVKTGVLPDFFIGAHAKAEKYKLLTRDAGRYKTYFPKIKLICP